MTTTAELLAARLSAFAGASCLTDSAFKPKVAALSLSSFITFNNRRGASEKRIDMAEVATHAGISIRISYGYTTPVFSAVTNHGKAVIEIGGAWNVIFNTLHPPQLVAVLSWAKTCEADLLREWSKTQSNFPVGRIN
jgi:hypothetical protein